MAHTLNFTASKTEDGYDFYPQFEYITDKISSKDFAIGNFETVMAGEDRRYSGTNMIFNAPDSLGESLIQAGFDIMTTANNHSLDRGYSGIKRTLEVFDEQGMLTTGTARSKEESEQILHFKKDTINMALLSYSFSTNGWPIPEEHPYSINMIDEVKIVQDIKKAKSEGAEIVMIGVHWGLEYHLNENSHQRRLTDIMFKAGADIVLGTHPHVLQPFEHKKMIDDSGIEKDKFIIYSQGNFISGQRTYPRAIGMYINFDISKVGQEAAFVKSVSVMPTYVTSKYRDGQRYVRIYETIDKDELIDMNEITSEEYRLLDEYESYFVEHLSQRMELTPYINGLKEYVIYE
jgi:poly-gamma-glutamate synthesis protein (capsule biosynthesis protein)